MEHIGLALWSGAVSSMAEPHRHHEIEFNLVLSGSIDYLFAGRELHLEPSQLLIFWAAFPHRLTQTSKNTTMIWLTLPLATWLRFDLPASLTQAILQGIPMTHNHNTDQEQFKNWLEDQKIPSPEQLRILELEIEARLRRFALSDTPSNQIPSQQKTKVAQMAAYIANHYLEPLQVAKIAKTVGLNSNYASEIFRATFAMTLLEYLTQQRIAHAQRLLVTTQQSILEIAFGSGFGSASRFYAAFGKACGLSPSAYRKHTQS